MTGATGVAARGAKARRPSAAVAALAALVALAALRAEAAEPARSFTVSPWAFEKLEEAQRLLGEEKYGEARQVLQEMSRRKGLTDHERALMLQTLGYVAAGEERYREAARHFEECLELDALPEGVTRDLRYNLAQLYVATEQYAKAVSLLRRWLESVESPPPAAFYLLAAALAQSGDRAGALGPAREAVRRSPQPKEAWMQLLLSLLLDQKRYRESVPVLEQLAERFPKKSYYQQLAAVFGQLGADDKALAALQLAHLRGLLDADREVRNLVQMYLYREIPFHGGRLLESAMGQGLVAGDGQAWELLADCWLRARELDRALPALERAASLSPKGELYLRLGRIHMERERWDAAARALQAALRRGGLRDPGQAYLLLGIAQASSGALDAAVEALHQARRFKRVRDQALQWLRHVESKRGERAQDDA